ncbi:MAG: LVIVD repeat-containing protein, partial [Actinomycetota bacterium]
MRLARPSLVIAAMLVVLLPGVGSAGPDAVAHGVTSANVEHVRFVPFEPYSATGARLVGKYLYVTSWKSISIYDVSNPEDPQLASLTTFAPTASEPTPDVHRFENEDLPTNGKILIFSETGATLVGGGSNHYRVYDVTNPAAPVQIANVPGIAQHTMTCIYDCTYTYGSGGNIVDLSNPAEPKLVANWRTITGAGNAHDVREVAPGLVAVASNQGQILDTTDPVNPKIVSIAGAGNAKPQHSNTWPNQATDRFLLGASETNLQPQCNGTTNGATSTWDMTNYRSGVYTFIDSWRADNGILFDGSPPANALGCSAHWLEASPAFSNGGVFAQGYYEHGTRFFYVNGAGELRQVGYFVPFGGSTSAPHWITDRIVYAIDYTRGIDILRWKGALPSEPDAANGVQQLSASSTGAVSGVATFLGEDAPNVIAEDPPGDGPGGAPASEAGIDITKVGVSQPDATYPELVATWNVSNLPNPVTGMQPENVRYVWSFTAGGKQWFVQAKASALAQSTTPDDPTGTVTKTTRAFQLRGNCAVVVAINSCGHVAWLDGSFDATNKTVSVRVPLGASFAPEINTGAVLAPVTPGGTADIYAALQ